MSHVCDTIKKCEHEYVSTGKSRVCIKCGYICKPASSEKQEKTEPAKCESWLGVNGQYVECIWNKDHIGCHSGWLENTKYKWKAERP